MNSSHFEKYKCTKFICVSAPINFIFIVVRTIAQSPIPRNKNALAKIKWKRNGNVERSEKKNLFKTKNTLSIKEKVDPRELLKWP